MNAATSRGGRAAVARPNVGIVLTTYNGAEFLGEQLDSLLGQAGVSIHVYAFDDGSLDDTVPILKAYAEAHPGIFSLFQNSRNSGGTGLNVIRNLKNVRSDHDYVALADQDDVWLPDKLKRAVAALAGGDADLYFSNLLAWDGDGQVLGLVRKAATFRAHDHVFAGGSAGCTYVLSMPFFEHVRSVLASADFGSARRVSHDWIIYFIARHDGFRVCASSEALIKYRIHPGSQYGGMWRGGVNALRRKFQMLSAGFLREQIDNALAIAREGTADREILLSCKRGRLARLAMLARYRFSLVREGKRFFYLAFALLLFR